MVEFVLFIGTALGIIAVVIMVSVIILAAIDIIKSKILRKGGK